MNCRPRTLAIVCAAFVIASACSRSPTQPSANRFGDIPSAPAASVLLSNLSNRFVGMSDQICGAATANVPIDDLTVDYQVIAVSIAGALLVACDTDACDHSVPLGSVVECPVPPDPCASGLADQIAQGAGPVCLTGNPTASGTLHMLARHPSNGTVWNVRAYFANTGDSSNTVSAGFDQPQEPAGSSDDSSTSSLRPRSIRRLHR